MLKNTRFAVVCLLLAVAGAYVHLHSDMPAPVNRPFREFPVRHKDWRMISQASFSGDILAVLNPTDYLARKYAHPMTGPVSLYIGYHDSGGVHSPRHCLPGSGWFRASEKEMVLDVDGGRLNLMQAVYQKEEAKELLLYWYQARGKSLTDEYSLKLHEIADSFLRRRRDVAFVRISVTLRGNEEEGLSAGMRFVRDFYPLIRDFLPG